MHALHRRRHRPPWASATFGMGLLPKKTGPRRRGKKTTSTSWTGGSAMKTWVVGINMGISQGSWSDPRMTMPVNSVFRCLAGGGRFGFFEQQGQHRILDRAGLKSTTRCSADSRPLTGKTELYSPNDRGRPAGTVPDGQLLFVFQTTLEFPISIASVVTRITADARSIDSRIRHDAQG